MEQKIPEQAQNKSFRYNQLGYYPQAVKQVFIKISQGAEAPQSFSISRADNPQFIFSGSVSKPVTCLLAGDTVCIADISALNEPGEYVLHVPGIDPSALILILNHAYRDVLQAAIKSYYFQRASVPLTKEAAGQWERQPGHPDTLVFFHPSSGRTGQLNTPGGWYDAGDFGKYVVNGGFALGQLLFLYEQYPRLLPDNHLTLPEGGNGRSDFLDEMKVCMDWLLTMQDTDGGCFVKVTTRIFPGMIMPEADTMSRWVIGKSTAASLNMAAAGAKMYRAMLPVDALYANRCLKAAVNAWQWAVTHPEAYFGNPDDIKTGEYGDGDMQEEFFWAAAELFVSTGELEYLQYIRISDEEYVFREGSNWSEFGTFLGLITLTEHHKENALQSIAAKKLLQAANQILHDINTNDYLQPVDDFHWASNSDVLDAAMICAQAYRITGKKEYLHATQQSADYIFGKNPLCVSFVTGFGHTSPLHIHHRQSAADGISAPVPGLLSGGPNSRLQDAALVHYPIKAHPMRCWVDDVNSYASNEVAINWNSALIYVLGFLEAEAR